MPPVTKWRKRISELLWKPFRSLSPDQRFWIGFAFLCIITTLLVFNPFWRAAGDQAYQEGDIARESIIAPADIYFTDEAATEQLRNDAKNLIKPIFRYEANNAEQAVQGFLSSWEKLQRHGGDKPAEQKTAADAKNETHWTGAGGPDVGKVLASRTFSRNELDAVETALHEAAEGYIYDDSEKQYFQNSVFVFDKSKPGVQSTVAMPESNWTSLSVARAKFRTRLAAIKSLSPKEADAFYTAGEILIEPSVSYDSVATETARQTAAETVQPQTVSLKRGQKIVDQGERIKPETLSKIAAVSNYSSTTRKGNRFLGLLLLITGLYWAAWKFIQHRGMLPRLALSAEKTFALFGFIVASQTVLMAVLFRLAQFTAAQNVKAPFNDATIWSFAIPFAAGSLLMTLLADRPTAFFTGLFCALLAGFMAPRGLEFAVYAAIASSVAVYGIGRYRSRQTVTIAGSFVGVVSSIAALAVIAYTQQPFILDTVLMALLCGLIGGMITAAMTAVILPVCETIFGILTDVKLLELSNADLPILGQLALRAPGTNQHSHAVGQLAEEACRAVGGNGLLTRIGALYHCLLYTSPSPRDRTRSRMPSSA